MPISANFNAQPSGKTVEKTKNIIRAEKRIKVIFNKAKKKK